ncbi:MAG: protein kinase, partial [Acidobacteria bacterium]|nr:protein kinase [Acidobacteriota bacterium]
VALKVINPARARPESIERFEREARAAAALNHPNILAVFDVSMEGPVPYVVSELLQGESLRARLDRGSLPYHKALEYGIQIAQGLAAAHGKGIYHRDVKPANVFLTHDGQVKLLDFGLAKLTIPDPLQDSGEPTVPELSHAGHALGTVGYMSPEQVLGEEIDHRADIFALGAVLYEMLTGKRAFQRATPYETMYAVRKEEPEDPLAVNPSLAPGAAVAVRRCLEKSRDERFQSARDLAFHLNQLAQSTTGSQPIQPRTVSRRRLLVPGALAAVVVAGALAWLWPEPTSPPSFLQVTFHRGRIGGARFAGQSIVYSETLGRDPPEVSLRMAGGPEARRLGYVDADVLAACSGELLLLTRQRFVGGERFVGTLAMAPLGGGTPHAILENVEDADCEAGGDRLVVARARGLSEESHLEYPVGNVLYRSPGSLHEPRVSPDGRYVAFREDTAGLGDGGRILVVDQDGEVVLRTRGWTRARGLAWSPEGDEVWFAAAEERVNRALRAVRLDGRERLVHEGPGSLTLWDTAPDGRVLVTREDERVVVVGQPPGATREIDLSWFDYGGLGALSSDGQLVVLGDRFGIYLRHTDGSPAAKLGSAEGFPDDLSPDGKLVLATTLSGDGLFLVPTGAGEVRPLAIEGIQRFYGSHWFPDSHRILVNGREPDRKLRSYVTDVTGRTPEPVTEEGTWTIAISPDGEQLAAIADEGGITLWPVAGGPPRAVPGSELGDRPVGWAEDGESLWIFRRSEVPAHIDRLEIATGRREHWRALEPADAAGVYSILGVRITPSGHSYFYNYRQTLSELYEARGLR